jgi:hypothetical protein
MRHQHACRVVAAALFAALCGAIECQPATLVLLAGPILWDATDAGEVLRFYRDFVRDAPDELGTVVRFGTAPPLPVIPEDLHWRPVIHVRP